MKIAALGLLIALAGPHDCDDNLPRAPAGERGVDRFGRAYENPTPTSNTGDVSVSIGASAGTGGVSGNINATVPLSPPAAFAPPP